jgi:hypothetical protein
MSTRPDSKMNKRIEKVEGDIEKVKGDLERYLEQVKGELEQVKGDFVILRTILERMRDRLPQDTRQMDGVVRALDFEGEAQFIDSPELEAAAVQPAMGYAAKPPAPGGTSLLGSFLRAVRASFWLAASKAWRMSVLDCLRAVRAFFWLAASKAWRMSVLDCVPDDSSEEKRVDEPVSQGRVGGADSNGGANLVDGGSSVYGDAREQEEEPHFDTACVDSVGVAGGANSVGGELAEEEEPKVDIDVADSCDEASAADAEEINIVERVGRFTPLTVTGQLCKRCNPNLPFYCCDNHAQQAAAHASGN